MSTGFNGSGTFVRQQNWTNDANLGNPISATKFDEEGNGVAGGFNNCLTRDNQGKPTAPLTWTQAFTITGATITAAGGLTVSGAAFTSRGITDNATATALTLSSNGNATFAAPSSGVGVAINGGIGGGTALTLSGSGQHAGLNTTNATGGYIVWQNSGTAVGYVGSGSSTISGTALGDFGVTAGSGTFRIGYNSGASTAMSVGTSGNVTINAPSSGTALTVNASSGQSALTLSGSGGNSILTLTSSGAYSSYVNFGAAGGGSGFFQVNGTTSVSLPSNGGLIVAAPTSGVALTVNGVSGTHSTKIADSATNSYNAGFLEVPQNAQSSNYTCVLSDSGKHMYNTSAGAMTYTIPANASVAYPIGTVLTFVNLGSVAISIAINSDTLYLQGSGSTGTRTLATFSLATAIKTTSTAWLISGAGLS